MDDDELSYWLNYGLSIGGMGVIQRELDALKNELGIEPSIPETSLYRAVSQDEISQEPKPSRTCVLCLHGYGEGCMNSNSTVVETFCCHRFHKTCLDSWLGKKNSCPLCVEMLRQVRTKQKPKPKVLPEVEKNS